MNSNRILVYALGVVLVAASPSVAGDYQRLTAEEALSFLKTVPPVGRRIEGTPQLVQLWADKTADDIRTMTEVKPGGHIEGGAHFHLAADDWRYFTAFDKLETAELWEVDGADDTAFRHLGHLSHKVTSISLEGVSITADGLSPLWNLPNPKVLRVGWSKGVSDEALAPIAGMSSLEELLIAGNKEIRGPGLSHLTGLKNLRTLNVAGTSIEDGALEHIGRIGALEHLTVSRCDSLSGSGFAHLSELGLTTLLLNRTAVGDETIGHLVRIPGLETLNLSHCGNVTPEGLKVLEGLRNLKRLELSGTAIDDPTLSQLAAISSLEHLNVNACGSVTGVGAAALSGMEHLKVLNLSNCSVTDESLPALKDLQVEELIIGNNGITTEGVEALLASPGSLKRLKKIHLWHIGKEERGSPTDEQIAPLQALRPDVEIAY